MSEVTRRDAIKLAAAGAALAVGTATVSAQDSANTAGDQAWDCLRNNTGKNLLITLASGHVGGPGYHVPQNGVLQFAVRKTTKKMAYVAYEYGTNTLVKMEEFTVFHQEYPPTNCLVITATKKAAERHKEATPTARNAAPAAPLPH
jgi:hypothetical protein